MILVRIGILVLGCLIFIGAVEVLEGWFPCPDPNPPAGLGAAILTRWGWLVWLVCLVYTVIPVRTFQFWSLALPMGFLFVSILAFYISGDFPHALFLFVHGVISILFTVVAVVVVSTLVEMLQWGSMLRFVVVPLVSYVAVSSWAYVQAIGFSQSVC